MPDSYLSEIAALTGLQAYPKQGPFGDKAGAVIGEREGYLVSIGPSKTDNRSAIAVAIRYPEVSDAKLVEAEIRAAHDKSEGKLVAVEATLLHWIFPYTFKKPAAQEVVAGADALIATLKKVAPGYTGYCELCKSSRVSEILLLNQTPGYYCESCQQKLHTDLAATAQNYEQIPANYPNALVLGVGAALLGSIAWGGVAYAINRIFLIGAIGIGFLVTIAIIKGMGRTNRAAQVMSVILTLASVLLGDAVFFTLLIMRETESPFSMELVQAVLANFWQLESESGGGIPTLIFALAGAGYALYHARKPAFKAQFERLGQPAT